MQRAELRHATRAPHASSSVVWVYVPVRSISSRTSATRSSGAPAVGFSAWNRRANSSACAGSTVPSARGASTVSGEGDGAGGSGGVAGAGGAPRGGPAPRRPSGEGGGGGRRRGAGRSAGPARLVGGAGARGGPVDTGGARDGGRDVAAPGRV